MTLAANQVLLQFLSITAYALDGFAFAAEALVGQTLGRRDRGGAAPRGDPHLGVGRRHGAGDRRWCFVGSGPWLDRPDGDRARGPRRGPRLPALDGGGAADRHRRLDARRHLHRRDRDPGHAQRRCCSRSRSTPSALALLLPRFGNHGLWAALMVLNATRGITLALRYPALEARAA